MSKQCTKCNGEFTWKQPYDGTKEPCGTTPCTCTPRAVKAAPQKQGNPEPANTINSGNFVTNPTDEFTTLARKAYLVIYPLACELNSSDATAKDNHIFTCGLLHDYFTFRAGKGL